MFGKFTSFVIALIITSIVAIGIYHNKINYNTIFNEEEISSSIEEPTNELITFNIPVIFADGAQGQVKGIFYYHYSNLFDSSEIKVIKDRKMFLLNEIHKALWIIAVNFTAPITLDEKKKYVSEVISTINENPRFKDSNLKIWFIDFGQIKPGVFDQGLLIQ
ncbi:MAG: hypothetical protein Q7S33_02400 [Nanoarchaeota archaeon]|nr:hypothetical protein [Nanoarchaeota archaeon]